MVHESFLEISVQNLGRAISKDHQGEIKQSFKPDSGGGYGDAEYMGEFQRNSMDIAILQNLIGLSKP
jgi:hypothetical protein